MSPDLEGREFDWFAIDGEGNVAMFATAGEGFIPDEVLSCIALHEDLTEYLPAPHTGSAEVWSDYAALGLYVFDWSLHGGPYLLQRRPSAPVACELRERVRGITGLPVYPGSFSRLGKLSTWEVA